MDGASSVTSSTEEATHTHRSATGWAMSSARKVLLLALLATVAVRCSTWARDVGNIYTVNCANCHGADGRGNTVLGRTLNLHDLRSPEVRRLKEDELLAIVSRGADRGRMPGFEKKLGIETVRTLVAYVRNIENQPIPVPQIKKATSSEASSKNGDVKSVYSAKCSHCHRSGKYCLRQSS
jgi:cytochrome c6